MSIRATFTIAVLMLLASCATTVRDVPPTASPVAAGKGPIRITGYTTTDGIHHPFDGTVQVNGDSLVFFAPAKKGKGLETARAETQLRLATTDVASVKYFSANILGSVLFVAMFVLVGTIVYYYSGLFDD